MLSVSMLKVTEVEVPDDPRAVRPVVPELVDQYAWYVTAAPVTEVPSVYVVTAFQERVSAAAGRAIDAMAITRKTMRVACLFLFMSWYLQG
jgi:hypothetical protein